MLTVIQLNYRNHRGSSWLCRCDCGSVSSAWLSFLVSGRTISCGCKKSGFHFAGTSRRRINLSGKRFGKWLVIELYGVTERGCVQWLCRCDCGTERPVASQPLRNGLSQSCGCRQSAITAKRNLTHGKSRTAEYRTWASMKSRCFNKNTVSYKNYGGRGLTVCSRWLGTDGFYNFLDDMGLKPSDRHTIERRDNSKGYCPENCRWATREEQSENRRNVHQITFSGERKTIKQWSVATGIPHALIWRRLRIYGWTVEKALTTRPRKNSLRTVRLSRRGSQ